MTERNEACPVVPRTFLNEASCVRMEACSPTAYGSVDITLDHNTLRTFYETSSHLFYAVTGLQWQAGCTTTCSPCYHTVHPRTQRWIMTPGCAGLSPTAGVSAESQSCLEDMLTAVPVIGTTSLGQTIKDVYTTDAIPLCTACDTALTPSGTIIQVGADCWEHTYKDNFNVYDFGTWALNHGGNRFFSPANNPIERWAKEGKTELVFPSSHNIGRWEHGRATEFQAGGYLGVQGGVVDFATFPPNSQSAHMAALLGAEPASQTTGWLSCGSPGEVAAEPTLGHRNPLDSYAHSYRHLYRPVQRTVGGLYEGTSKTIVHTMVTLTAPDQLRQRMAWALSQIFVVATQNTLENSNEDWHTFTDILVRNAFGNLQTILREVSYSPQMGEMLTFEGSKMYSYLGLREWPDENYARELMQLFTIGLWQLNLDGSRALDAEGKSRPTYDNDNVRTFAKVWTGFENRASRSNLDAAFAADRLNKVDPMQVVGEYRDMSPKMNLYSGYLGDSHARCAPAMFLQAGTKYLYLGRHPKTEQVKPRTSDSEADPDVHFEAGKNGAASDLYEKLCAPASPLSSPSPCSFPSQVILTQTIPCTVGTSECAIDAPRTVRIVDRVTNEAVYYEYVRAPCIELAFYDGRIAQKGSLSNLHDQRCSNPHSAQTVGTTCCDTVGSTISDSQCEYYGEGVTWAKAYERCAELGKVLCQKDDAVTGHKLLQHGCASEAFDDVVQDFWGYTLRDRVYMHVARDPDWTRWSWMQEECSVKVQIDPNGRVSRVSPDALAGTHGHVVIDLYAVDNGNYFRVRWGTGGGFPTAPSCASASNSACSVPTSGDSSTCLCDVTVSSAAVFSVVPAKSEVEESLHVGHRHPDASTGHTLCEIASDCGGLVGSNGVDVYVGPSGVMDANTVFGILVNTSTGSPQARYLLNELNMVQIDTGVEVFEFRNPPQFMNVEEPTTRDAIHETQTLLDHLAWHNNAAPFIATRLVQRFVTSNPSPRYILSVVEAFRTGSYQGVVYSGSYGCLKATLVAVLLDREARSSSLEAAPTFGRMREPYLMLLQSLRGLNLVMKDGQPVEFANYGQNLQTLIGQRPLHAPSVFGFYGADYQPFGPIKTAGMTSPESELFTGPYTISLINALASLSDYGFSECDEGFSVIGKINYCRREWSQWDESAGGKLSFVPENPTDAEATVDELDLVLTQGRLSDHVRATLILAYNQKAATNGGWPAALKHVYKLLFTSAEFHTTNVNLRHSMQVDPPPPPPTAPSSESEYKAVVVISLFGGMDSFNFLVPHSGCKDEAGAARDYHAEYTEARGENALPLSNIVPISATGGSFGQPCDMMGINADAHGQWLAQLYNDGDAAFLANIGCLVEPVTKSEVLNRTKRVCPSVGSHNSFYEHMQTLDPEAELSSRKADGVLGRIFKVLEEQGLSSSMYTTGGTSRMLEGGPPQEALNQHDGVRNLDLEKLNASGYFDRMLSERGTSVFGETHNRNFKRFVDNSERVGAAFAAVESEITQTGTTGFDNPTLGCMTAFKSIAKIIKARNLLGSDRDALWTWYRGFDGHAAHGIGGLGGILECAEVFIRELESEAGLWDRTTIILLSEFGRTISR